MKKIFYLLVFLIFACSNNNPYTIIIDGEGYKLYGEVKSVKLNGVEAPIFLDEACEFRLNEKGQLVFFEYCDEFGNSSLSIKYYYGKNGEPIRAREKTYLDSGSETHNYDIEVDYDKNGNLNEMIWEGEDDYELAEEFEYDEDNNLIYYNIGNPNEIESWKEFENIYDNDNRIVEREYTYFHSEKSDQKIKFKYDDKGNIKSLKHYIDGELTATYRFDYEFDKFGNWIERVISSKDADDVIFSREIEYFDGSITGDIEYAKSKSVKKEEPVIEAEAPAEVESVSESPIDDIFYVITDTATKTESKARELVDELKLDGYRSDYLWIPDYNSLSGAEYFLVYIGPFYNILECAEEVEKYREIKPSSYGIGVSNSYERVEIRGVGKIKRTSL
tara:strand:+ start:142 stop:1308 length:1167 start_codon:yes stop_codon:yes gene_type:complete